MDGRGGLNEYAKNGVMGLHTVVQPGRSADIDIVAVHGLNGHCVRTWSFQEKNGKSPTTYWLRDLLPNEMPNARVMTFQYESKVLFNKATGGVSDTADQLFRELQTKRKDVKPERPIVFLAHSLGGILVKQALIAANSKYDSSFHDIARATKGIVFFGTPHRGSDVADALDPVHKITSIGWERLRFFSVLKSHSDGLLDISDEFRRVGHKYALVSFYEQHIHPMLRNPVVTKESSIMGFAHEEVMMLGGDHSSMCKFSRGDPRFETVCMFIRSAAKSPPAFRGKGGL